MLIYILLGYVLFAFVVFRILRFFLSPLLRRTGFIKYYSPMFCLLRYSKSGYDFHLGTSYDFFRVKNITPKKTLYYLGKGLYNLCEAIEQGKISADKKFRGNTFYLKDKTAKSFGFRCRKMNLFEKILFVQNYLELVVLNSILHKKFTLIPLDHIRIMYSTGTEILKYKNKYKEIVDRLERPISESYQFVPQKPVKVNKPIQYIGSTELAEHS